MSNSAECAAYFQGNPAWEPILQLMRKKWESYGALKGSIVIHDGTEEQRRLLEGIVGAIPAGMEIKVSLKRFEDGLQQTRFSPVLLHDVLEDYFGVEIISNAELKRNRERERDRFFGTLIEKFDENEGRHTSVAGWLREIRNAGSVYGSGILLGEWEHDEAQAVALVESLGRAMEQLQNNAVEGSGNMTGAMPLAVLAAKATGNPHYFDRDRSAGKLLTHLLSYSLGLDTPNDAGGWRKLLMEWGIIPDEISNTVAVYGLHLMTECGLHPAFEGYCRMREAGVVTMMNLRSVTGAYGEGGKIYIVENEMIFEELCRREPGGTLICTSGQPSTCALGLLALIAEGGTGMCYSGDMDPEGIRIADRLAARFGERLEIWRMAPEDYYASLSKEIISDSRLRILDPVSTPELLPVCDALRKEKRAAYQENLLEELVGDIFKKI